MSAQAEEIDAAQCDSLTNFTLRITSVSTPETTNAEYPVGKAFDGNPVETSSSSASRWLQTLNANCYAVITFANPVAIDTIRIWNQHYQTAASSPKGWTIYGSNTTDTAWVEICRETVADDWGSTINANRAFRFANTTQYTAYKIQFTALQDSSAAGSTLRVAEIALYNSNLKTYWWTGNGDGVNFSSAANWIVDDAVPATGPSAGDWICFANAGSVVACNDSAIEPGLFVKRNTGALEVTNLTANGGVPTDRISKVTSDLKLSWTGTPPENPIFADTFKEWFGGVWLGGATQQMTKVPVDFWHTTTKLYDGTYLFTNTSATWTPQFNGTFVIGKGATAIFDHLIRFEAGDKWSGTTSGFHPVLRVVDGAKVRFGEMSYTSNGIIFGRRRSAGSLELENGSEFDASGRNVWVGSSMADVNIPCHITVSNSVFKAAKLTVGGGSDGRLHGYSYTQSNSIDRGTFAANDGSTVVIPQIEMSDYLYTGNYGNRFFAITDSTLYAGTIHHGREVVDSADRMQVRFNGAVLVPTSNDSMLFDDRGLYESLGYGVYHCDGAGLCISNANKFAVTLGARFEGDGPVSLIGGGSFSVTNRTAVPFGSSAVTVGNDTVLALPGEIAVGNAVTLEPGATLDIGSVTSRGDSAAVCALSATGSATVRLTGTMPDSVFSTGTNFIIAASCDAATLANITFDMAGLSFENAGTCSNARLNVENGRLILSVKPYFFIKVK